jgi:hypothetical protein
MWYCMYIVQCTLTPKPSFLGRVMGRKIDLCTWEGAKYANESVMSPENVNFKAQIEFVFGFSPSPYPPSEIHFYDRSEPVFADLLWGPGIDFQPGGPVRQPYVSYRHVRQHRLAKSIPRKRFLGSLNVYKYGLLTRNRFCGIDVWRPSKF